MQTQGSKHQQIRVIQRTDGLYQWYEEINGQTVSHGIIRATDPQDAVSKIAYRTGATNVFCVVPQADGGALVYVGGHGEPAKEPEVSA